MKIESDQPDWSEVWVLFVQAPITIFMVDTFLQLLANVTFMFILFGEDRAAKGLSNTEYYLAIFMSAPRPRPRAPVVRPAGRRSLRRDPPWGDAECVLPSDRAAPRCTHEPSSLI